MKKKMVRLFMVLTVLMCIFSLNNKSVYAIDAMQDGIKVISQTDKNSYKKDEKVTTIVTVTNTNSYDMKNVNIHISVPDEFSADETGFNIPLLKSNETKEYKVTVIEKNLDVVVQPNDDNKTNATDNASNAEKGSGVNTGDQLNNGIIVGLIGLTVFSGIAAVCLKKKRKIKKLFIFALISAMTLSGLSVKTVHAEDSSMTEKHIYLTQPFSYENKTYKMDIDVQYMISNDEAITKGEITREEWITKLLSLFDYNINDREYSFSDYADAKNPKIIETAIQYSVIDIEDNEAFYPTEYATREFVAYTAIMALRLTNTSKGSLQCSDSADLLYPDEVYLAVQNEMINLVDNQFKPHQYISKDESEQVIKVITEILDSCKINSENKNYIDYQDNVKEINQDYQTVSDNIIEIKDLQGLKKGDFAVINSSNGEGIAIKVEDITKVNDNQYKIQYNEAKLENILESLHVEGIEDNTDATFIPEEDVTVENMTQLQSRAKYDSVPLNKELKLSTTIKDLSASISLDLEEIQYRFDLDYSLFSGLKLNDAYFALATDLNANLTYEGDENLIERDEPEKIEKKIGTIKIPLQYGFNVGCDVYLTGTINGKLEINVTLSNTTGFQYVKNNFRTIADTKTELAKMEISASARFGVKPVAGIEWMNFDIANANANVGIGIDGKVENQLVAPYQFCIDAKAYLYASIGEELLPDITDKLSNDVDIYTANHSPFKISGHFEETGKVDKCTRDQGSYYGVIKDSQTGIVLSGAQIKIFKENNLVETLISDDNGQFIGKKLDSGEYTLFVQANGYELYQQAITIIGGQDISLVIMLTKKIDQDNTVSIGETYRFTNITQEYAFVVLQANEDAIYDFCYSDNNHSILNELDKGTIQSYAVDSGKYIDITIKEGNISMYARKDGESNYEDISTFYGTQKLDHEAVKIFECLAGQKVSIDYQKIGNNNTWVGASIYFQGNVIEEYYNYYWNVVKGDEIIYEKNELNMQYPNLWPIFEEGTRREYTVKNGVLYVYFPYESDDYRKLTINID